MHTVAHWGLAADMFAEDMGDDEGVVRIRGGVDDTDSAGGFAARYGARFGGWCGAYNVCAAAEVERDGGIQSAACVSGVE